ncbi:MAG: hypothetical protein IPN92_20125 [Chromatiaceae bacterium]|nr:hypothetical protein [Chromatiaceae bacterium]
MCGYCIEGGVTLDFIERQRVSEKLEFENNWVPIYLQESTNFPEIIDRIKAFDNFPGSIDIAFYRLWEAFLNQEHDGIYHRLANEYGEKAIKDYLVGLKSNYHNENWKFLGDSELYIKKGSWEHYLGNVNQLIDDSESTLKSYLDFWICGENKEISDPEKRIEETGIMDPIENTTPKDWNSFYTLFPVVFFSFLIVKRFKNDSDFLRRIALESPHDVPDFLGYDLWLQRKAFVVCVKNYGIQFILDNYDDIRLELIYYTLIKESFCVADLDEIKDHILSHEHWVNGVDSDSVVELINNLESIA